MVKRRNPKAARAVISFIPLHRGSAGAFMALRLINISLVPLKNVRTASIWQTSGSSAGALASLTPHFIVFRSKHLQSICSPLFAAHVWLCLELESNPVFHSLTVNEQQREAHPRHE